MQALWLEDQSLSFRTHAPRPSPGHGQARIQMTLAGVCSTDLELQRGYYPFTGIPGHEFVGIVADSPDDSAWVGQRVVGEINIACGECAPCKSGLQRHCEHRKALGIHDWNGAFAEYLVLPLSNLHAVPAHVPDEMAVFTEPLAAAGEILEQVDTKPGNQVLVIGAGRLGQLVAAVLNETGCDLHVIARHPKQRELLARLNIKAVSEENLLPRGYDLIVDASGTAGGFTLACRLVRPRGKIIMKSTFKGKVETNISQLVVDEVTLVGSRCGPFEPALRRLAKGVIDPRLLIEAIYPLQKGSQAFELAAQPGVLKVLLKPGG
ncbi:MAG: MDR/zinc-dependent alcohol dehydrogenase-like family protein [Acidobacteriaceae bacterium]